MAQSEGPDGACLQYMRCRLHFFSFQCFDSACLLEGMARIVTRSKPRLGLMGYLFVEGTRRKP